MEEAKKKWRQLQLIKHSKKSLQAVLLESRRRELQKEAVEGTGEAEEAEETEGKEAAETDDDMGEQGTAELLETIDKLEKKLAEHEQEKEALNNRLVRLQADFSNYRKRNEKEAEKLQSAIVAGLMEELLPVLDNFDRALTQEGSGEDFRKGIEMIHRQLLDFLEKQGVENIEAVGKEFDHNYHNAVQQVESDEYESGTSGRRNTERLHIK